MGEPESFIRTREIQPRRPMATTPGRRRALKKKLCQLAFEKSRRMHRLTEPPLPDLHRRVLVPPAPPDRCLPG